MLPIEYLESLSRLQDGVTPGHCTELERIVEEELGIRIKKAFADFKQASVLPQRALRQRGGNNVVIIITTRYC